jgi:hypothetical protein
MLERWESGILGGALSLSIHTLLLGLAGLIALEEMSRRTYPLSAGEILEPVTASLRPDSRERYLYDCSGGMEGRRYPVEMRKLPGVFDFDRGTSESLAPALSWLVRHQNEDGSWSADRFHRLCRDGICDGSGGSRCDDCVTALALLALSGAAQEERSEQVAKDLEILRRQRLVREALAKGMSWLRSRRAHYGGCLGSRPLADRLIHESWCGPLFLRVAGVPEDLMDRQKKGGDRCRDGSWDPEVPGENRVFLAAINTLRLEGHPNPDVLLGKCEGGHR